LIFILDNPVCFSHNWCSISSLLSASKASLFDWIHLTVNVKFANKWNIFKFIPECLWWKMKTHQSL
jgi:hypothetical protein